MSSYETKLDCPYCNSRTEGMAIDDYFGHHKYALKCGKCHTVWQKAEVEMVHVPTKELKCWKEVN